MPCAADFWLPRCARVCLRLLRRQRGSLITPRAQTFAFGRPASPRSRGIPFAWITNALSRARYSAVSERIMSRPRLTAGATPKLARAPQKLCERHQSRITLGLNFMKANAASLASAFERWQVPPEIITAVIGVETIYGKSTGNIKTLDALATLSFDYTRRAAFFPE
ncbi:MAG: lytic murein transglycosylase [Duodenibacillus massiliensis]